MNFLNAQLYVVPPSNTLPTTGSTQNLTAGQFGIFKEGYAVATTGNAAAAKFLQVGQGRIVPLRGVPNTKLSDKIYKANITKLTKAVAQSSALVQVSWFSAFTAKCGETVSISLRLFSNYIKTVYANGLTQTVTVSTPCCACGADPCTQVDHQALVDQFVTAINANTLLNRYVVASREDYGTTSRLVITGIALTKDGTLCDPKINPYWFDRMNFRGFAYKGPATTQDYAVYSLCDPLATFTTVQEATYLQGESDKIVQMEKDYFSYNTSMKDIHRHPEFNGAYESNVVAGTFYDLFVLEFMDPENGEAWYAADKQKEAVYLAIPTGQAATIQTILENFSGLTTVVETASNPTSSTTTSTTTTSHS